MIRTGIVKMLEAEREYECSKCKHHFRVFSDMENNNTITLPKTCASTDNGKKCKGTVFTYLEGSRVCQDYQEVKLQEQVQKLTMGSIPRSILVILKDDLVDRCMAGDDVVLCGIVRHLWKPEREKDGACCELELMLDCHHVRAGSESKKSGGATVTPEQRAEFEQFWRDRSVAPLLARDLIVRSVCPQLYGLYMVKLAVLMTLIGGVAHTDPSGTRTRGESHMLLIGDPGTGKSQMLRYGAKLSARSVTTTGIGTTSAGLTVSVVRDTGGGIVAALGRIHFHSLVISPQPSSSRIIFPCTAPNAEHPLQTGRSRLAHSCSPTAGCAALTNLTRFARPIAPPFTRRWSSRRCRWPRPASLPRSIRARPCLPR